MTRYRTALLMALVMLFASLAPTISHALARASGSPYTLVEACTTLGVKIFAVPPVFLHAPRTPHVWLSAPARAPPLAI